MGRIKVNVLLSLFIVAITMSSYSSPKDHFEDCTRKVQQEEHFKWLIIGAGPAGLSVLGVLLDLKIPAHQIIWVDAQFHAGRIGEYYATVPANNITLKFVDFINACEVFKECKTDAINHLKERDPQEFPELGIMIPVLSDLTAFLRTKVPSHQGWLTGLHFKECSWHATVGERHIRANNVVLATGSHPKEFQYTDNQDKVIPLDFALDKNRLSTVLSPDDVVGVVGGSHSGILVIKFLYELQVPKIINLFRSPIAYTTSMGDWNLNAYNGLKGLTAQWAREVLEGPNPPANIVRVYNNEENRNTYLPLCTKLIYSVGYERNDLPLMEEYGDIEYDDKTGVIAPGLFGIGIAFPEYYIDPLGNKDHRVGLTSFMDYAQRMVPEWVMSYSDDEKRTLRHRRDVLQQFADLFIIDIL